MREYAILIPELPWMERIKPLSKQDTTHFQNSAEQNPEALLGKTVIFAELHSEKDHITYHFSRIRSVAVGNDTAIENSSGLPASDEGRFVLLGVDSPLGPEILNTFQDYSMLLELVSAANKSAKYLLGVGQSVGRSGRVVLLLQHPGLHLRRTRTHQKVTPQTP